MRTYREIEVISEDAYSHILSFCSIVDTTRLKRVSQGFHRAAKAALARVDFVDVRNLLHISDDFDLPSMCPNATRVFGMENLVRRKLFTRRVLFQ